MGNGHTKNLKAIREVVIKLNLKYSGENIYQELLSSLFYQCTHKPIFALLYHYTQSSTNLRSFNHK